MKINKNGQSILEYSVLFVAIVAVILVAVPMFLKPSANRYYNSAGGYIDGVATSVESLAADVPNKFSRTWSDYTFDPSANLPVYPPPFANATAGGGGATGGGGGGGGATGGGGGTVGF